MSDKILHLKTQRNQPYGSVRKCCEKCGKMIWGDSLPADQAWTDNPDVYENASWHGYAKCTRVGG